jgi:hydroxymethylglutaryl-CoA lyase
MAGGFPKIVFTDETMREGMQIESADIPVESKVELLNKLSQTGLPNIVVGSFVSPKYTPQMKNISEVMKGFKPQPGVNYTAMIPNEKGRERASEFAPPLNLSKGRAIPRTSCHQCDVFVRRNYNRTQMQEMASWVRTIKAAQENGATEAGIGTNATFGSNFLGDFPVEVTMAFLEKQHELWTAAGIKVTQVSVGDPMGWVHPLKIEQIFGRIKKQWPDVHDFRAHLHNSRGMATAATYTAIRMLDENDTLYVECTLGGVGGCPYCGNGQVTGMMPTEDFVHMLEGMGIKTGVDLDKLIECVWLLEKIIGRQAWGHVSRAGPRPTTKDRLFDANAPFVETVEQAKHFKLGPKQYEGGIVPWTESIKSPYLDRLQRGEPMFELNGNWPWQEAFFPKVDDLRAAGVVTQRTELAA